jgi:exosortase
MSEAPVHEPVGRTPPRAARPLAVAAVLGAGILWAYWPTLAEIAERWATDPRYSHGYLVPLFALALLWVRRDRLDLAGARPSAWGLALIAAGLGLRLAGGRFYLSWFEGVSLLPVLAGLSVLVLGWPSLRWSWPSIAFLAFMVPLPYRLEVALGQPLQRVATKLSTYALQTLGIPALSAGNVIQLDDVDLNVIEACSGLSMLFTFLAVATGVAMVVRRPWLDKALILAGSVPIALAVNVMRITVSGVMHETVGHRLADLVFHDLAGWLMMPAALVLLWLEVALLDRLLVEQAPRTIQVPKPLDVVRGRPGAGAHDGRRRA